MSALRNWKADLACGLGTALVAMLFASSGTVYAQKDKDKHPTSTAPARRAPASAAHSAAPAASNRATVTARGPLRDMALSTWTSIDGVMDRPAAIRGDQCQRQGPARSYARVYDV